jgi:tetratricopeptide (TPR) repeat protein
MPMKGSILRAALSLTLVVMVAPLPATAQDGLSQARSLFDRGRIDSALALIRQEADRRPDHAETHFWLGRIAGQKARQSGGLGRVTNAGRSKSGFSRAVQLEPNNLDYLEALARYLMEAPGVMGGDRDSAIALAERIRRERPAAGTDLLTDILIRGDEREKARADSLIAALDRASPTDLGVLRRVASHWARRGRPALALGAFERIVAREPEDGVAQLLVGQFLVVMGREPRRAQAHLRQAIDRWVPPTPQRGGYPVEWAWWRLGQSYVQLGNVDSARACYAEALRVNARFEQARRSLDSLNRR